MELAVELVQLREEARRDAVLLVEVERARDGGVADDVAVGQILGQDARARLLLLRDLVAVAVRRGDAVVARGLVGGEAGCGGDGDVRGAKLGVVEEEGGLGGGVLFERHGRGLGLAFDLDVEALDLATGRGKELALGA